MKKLLMLRGLPASGKSTRAKELVDSGNYVRVNRDDLRAMLHNGKWSGKNEDITVSVEKGIVSSALKADKNVVIDDCNLNPRNQIMWHDHADFNGASFEVETLKTPYEECVLRDAIRSKRVGKDVIIGMALQWKLFPVPTKGLVICDLDGTLCDIKHRLKYASGEEKDWKKFFEGIAGDDLRYSTLTTLQQARSRGHEVIFVSARPDTYREETVAWLEKHLPVDFTYLTLIMRRGGDKQDDTVVKQKIYDTYLKGYPIEFVIDDRPKVIRMWESNGLHVIDVGDGIEF